MSSTHHQQAAHGAGNGPALDQFVDIIEAGEKITIVDLFCGAGGMSSGAVRTLEWIADEVGQPVEEIAQVIAVNHWNRAIDTHSANYSWAAHFNCKVQELRPRELYWDDRTPIEDGDPIHLLIGCPDCTYFSTARGGGPKDPDSRATPREILDFVERLNVRNVLFENVPKFEDWGPLDDDNEVIKAQEGEYFDAWITQLTIEGFAVEWRVLNAADYGDATSRKRLFVAGRKDSGVSWPAQTHSEHGDVPGTEPWRTAADIIDWSDPGESVWVRDLRDGRRTPLKNNTMQRIAKGIRRHSDARLEPFADVIEDFGQEDVYDLRETIVPAEYAEVAAGALTEPFLVKYYGTSSTRPVDVPLDTVTSGGQKFALCTPYVLGQQSGARPRDVTASPLNTVATKGAISVVDPRTFVLPKNGKQRGLFSNQAYPPADRPLHTIVAGRIDQGYTVRPSLLRFSHGGASIDVDDPLPTVTTARCGDFELAQPYLVEYYGNGAAQPVDGPLPTVTTRDRFALVIPELYPLGIDILFRMLKPSELAAAMGFDSDYEFTGNKTETVKQIGNAVPVNLAESLCTQLLVGQSATLESFTDGAKGGAAGDD